MNIDKTSIAEQKHDGFLNLKGNVLVDHFGPDLHHAVDDDVFVYDVFNHIFCESL